MKWITLHDALLILVILPCGVYCDNNMTVYVVPDSDANMSCTCPKNVIFCLPLDEIINKYQDIDYLENTNLILVFLCGQHTLPTLNRSATINVGKLQSLSVLGESSDPKLIVIRDLTFEFQNVPTLLLADITVKDISFKVYPRNLSNFASFQIENCIFIQSDCLIVGSDLTLKDSTVINGSNTPFNLVLSSLKLAGNVTFMDNSGERGGALALRSTTLNISKNSNIVFSGNNASGKGGAIYVNNPTEVYKVLPQSDCFYRLLDYDENATYNVTFKGNSATFGGSHIFGASLKSNCTAAWNHSSYEVISSQRVFHFESPELSGNLTHSPVSNNPARICICDENDSPACLDHSKIIMSNISQYPGEVFTLSLVLVGGDFGTTIGVVHAKLVVKENENRLSPNESSYLNCKHKSQDSFSENKVISNQCYEVVTTLTCTKLQYVIYSGKPSVLLSLMATKSNLIRVSDQLYMYEDAIKKAIKKYEDYGLIEEELIYTPIFINITLKACPVGFHFDAGMTRCDCYSPLKQIYEKLECVLWENSGCLSLPNIWIGIMSSDNTTEVIMSRSVPPLVYNKTKLQVDLQDTTSIDKQCTFNHAGRFCGGCKQGHSLAIGTSHCIQCLNNNTLALLIFFAAAGVFLVIFIASLNLTVTQGMINGIIFYANIVWVYESLIFPSDHKLLHFPRVFIAWLNLDFGIETCFVVGLDAFWKTLLQYIFPLYIWSIVGVIILGARYSTRLTKFLGSRTVPVLCTLTLLSYMKLLGNAIVSLEYARLDYFNAEKKVRTVVVWWMDGTLNYFAIPHIFLFIAALVVVCLCVPFTLTLLFARWIREIPYFTRFHPIFDSYFAPIKDKHHYWPGLLLIVRAFLYLMKINLIEQQALFALLITIIFLQTFMSVIQPHRSNINFLLHTAFLVNLIILSGSILYIYTMDKQLHSEKLYKITIVSTTIAFVKFCIIVGMSLLKSVSYSKVKSYFQKAKYRETLRRKRRSAKTEDGEATSAVRYITLRDSILDDLPE